MPCKIKIKNLYVYDLFIDSEGKVSFIEYDKEKINNLMYDFSQLEEFIS